MKTLLTAAALAAAMLASSAARATEIGTIIRFNKELRLIAGCTEPDDAKQIKSFQTKVPQDWKIARYVEMNSLELDKNDRVRGCVILNEDPKEEWKIVDKVSVDPRTAWFCVASTIDYSDQQERRIGSYEAKTPCFWVWMLDKRSVR
jgi:hypothetical protein